MEHLKKYLAEMFGTMVLVLVGCGSAIMNGGATSVAAVLTIAFAFGLSVLTMVYTIGSISGCHINPAITFSMWLCKRISGKDAIGYMIFQVIGAIIGSAILFVIATPQGLTATGANQYAEGLMVTAFITEAVFTAIFVWVVLASTANQTQLGFAGLAIGLALTMAHIVCIPITGTSLNPARSIGPALFNGGVALSQLWLFIVAPLVGGILSGLLFKLLKK